MPFPSGLGQSFSKQKFDSIETLFLKFEIKKRADAKLRLFRRIVTKRRIYNIKVTQMKHETSILYSLSIK